MIVGYARTSTLDQVAGLEAQERELREAGCERIFVEQVSSVDMAERRQLAEALAFVREGDVMVVTRMDRLCRSIADLLGILAQLKARGASLRIRDLGIDTGSATGELVLTLLGGIAAFERRIMLERQAEGIAKAKAEGRYKGRAPTARAKGDTVRELYGQGVGPSEIARRLGIGRASVYRILGPRAA